MAMLLAAFPKQQCRKLGDRTLTLGALTILRMGPIGAPRVLAGFTFNLGIPVRFCLVGRRSSTALA
jgi:hypothetical protein